MRITKLELKGYKRFMLGAINHIVYTPESALQIILGTNGSGKSSLLQQLSPLPASPQDFSKDGFKKIWIEHQGIEYYLESMFKSSAQHQFIRYNDDGSNEELNPGHTGQVQRELVREVFGWTPQLHDLLTKQERFTRMSPSRRREWIMQLSTADYRYATEVFNRIQSKARDYQGTLKHLNNRISTEQHNLQTLEQYEGLDTRVEQLRTELNQLLISTDSTLPPQMQLEQEVNRILQQLTSLSEEIFRFEPDRTGRFRSISHIQQQRMRAEQQLQHETEALQNAARQYSELEHQAAELGQSDIEVPDNLDEQIAMHRKQLGDLQQKQVYDQITQPNNAYQQTKSIYNDLHRLFTELPDNSDNQFNPQQAQSHQEQIKALQSQIDNSNAKLTFIRHRKEVLSNTKETECPQCGNRWREGFDRNEIEQLDQWQRDHTQTIEQAEVQIKEHQKYLESYENVLSLYRYLRKLITDYPLLSPLWNRILEERRHIQNPNQSLGMLREWLSCCEIAIESELVGNRLKQLELISALVADGTLNHLAIRKQQLTQEVETRTRAVSELKDQVQEIRHTEMRYDAFLRHAKQLAQLSDVLRTAIEKVYRSAANQMLEQQVHRHQDELSIIQRNLNDLNTLKGIVKDLELDQEVVSKEHRALTVLSQELSPISGLIAEDIAGFIGCVVEQMNAIIQSVWTYDLSVLPCEMESGDLNYKFPLSNGQGAPVQDVSRGSEAQQDLVDFAFMLTVLMYLDIASPPLFLDELGASFDEQHRINVMSFVRQLVDSHRYSQLFFISHYASQYAAMSAAQILVLESTNIAVPQQHNEHIQFH